MMKCHPRIAQGQSPPPRMGCTPVRLASGLFPSLQIINVINNYEDRQYQNHQYHQYQNHQDYPMRKSDILYEMMRFIIWIQYFEFRKAATECGRLLPA